MNRKIRISIFIFFELFLIGLVLFLSYKIYILSKGKIIGIQYASNISKNYLIWDNSGTNLKYFYEPKPDSVMEWDPEWIPLKVSNRINHDSLHETINYTFSKPLLTYRIITIGDSFTFGQYVGDTENFSEILEMKLNASINCKSITNFEVLNLGVPGYDISYSVQRFLKRGVKYNPDLIIWLINEWNFLKINDLLIPKLEELTNAGVIDFDPKSKTYIRVTKAINTIVQQLGFEDVRSYQLLAMEQLQISNDTKLLIITFPMNITYQKLIQQFIMQHSNMLYHLLFDYWNQNNNQLIDGHPNIQGHKEIAEDIFKFLKKNILSYSCSES